MRSFTIRTEITKGWSGDKKYCVTGENGTRYFLRVSPREQYEEKQQEFDLMRRVFMLGVPMPQPLEFGLCAEGVYSLQTWIDGDDAEDIIGRFSETQQYIYGLAAGRALQKIHSIPAPESAEPWETRFNRKIDRKIKLYTSCGLRYAEDAPFFTYLRENRNLLKNRPQTLQHGDFHIGNMMLDRAGKLWIIDFNRRDYGDPWEEFNRIVWAAQKSPDFACGIVDGYFNGDVPMDFWRLLALYISSNTLSSLPWAIPFGDGQIHVMREQASEILQWYDHMHTVVPRWYRPRCLQQIDGVPFCLKTPFDFSFLSQCGRVFRVFDDQDSGNICFGLQKDANRYFVKFAGAPIVKYDGTPEEAILQLQAALPIYQDLQHENLIHLLHAKPVAGGFAAVFSWENGVGVGRMYPMAHERFMRLPVEKRLHVFGDIMDFMTFAASRGYVAVDFYDGSLLYDFETETTTVCDVDYFRKAPAVNDMGRMWGSLRFQAPEEHTRGARLDEVTNVYTLGATAFFLFAHFSREQEQWVLSDQLYAVAKKAVQNDREQRYSSVQAFCRAWRAALATWQTESAAGEENT